MEAEPLEEEQPLGGQVHDPIVEPDMASSTTSGVSSLLTKNEDSRSTTSSGDISSISGSSGEILAVLISEPSPPTHRIVDTAPDFEVTRTGECSPAARQKCVGRKKEGVTSWGLTSVIGRRKEMEDAVAVIPELISSRTCDLIGGCMAPGSRTSSEIFPVSFFGVYDGHGGSEVAKFCAKRMHEVIAEEWDRGADEGYEWRRRWEAAFASGFERTDNEILTGQVATEMVGSTAVVAVLSRCQIIVSNCGDSRAILCRGTQTIPLTVDQKPDRQDELLRIEGGGGKVINWNGARVFGVLAMSRAIGDRYLRPWIIPVPEISFTARTEEDECLILASDGLWDVMSNEEVGEVARRILRRWRRTSMSTDQETSCPAQVVADNLTEIAFSRSSHDNISIIVVDLRSIRKRQRRQ